MKSPQKTFDTNFKILPHKTALLIIDMQNAFLEPGAVYETSRGRKMIPKIENLIRYCRAANMTVIWTQTEHSSPYGGLILKKCWNGIPKNKIPQKVNGKEKIFSISQRAL